MTLLLCALRTSSWPHEETLRKHTVPLVSVMYGVVPMAGCKLSTRSQIHYNQAGDKVQTDQSNSIWPDDHTFTHLLKSHVLLIAVLDELGN